MQMKVRVCPLQHLCFVLWFQIHNLRLIRYACSMWIDGVNGVGPWSISSATHKMTSSAFRNSFVSPFSLFLFLDIEPDKPVFGHVVNIWHLYIGNGNFFFEAWCWGHIQGWKLEESKVNVFQTWIHSDLGFSSALMGDILNNQIISTVLLLFILQTNIPFLLFGKPMFLCKSAK